MHPENAKVLAHSIISNVQELRNPHIQTVLNDLQSSTNSALAGQKIETSHVAGFSSFYVSFRLASVLPAAHSWGAHIALSDISRVEQNLITQGCGQADAHKIAKQCVHSMVTFQFLLDCELLNLHEIFYIAGLGSQTDLISHTLFGESQIAADFGLSFAVQNLRSEYGIGSPQSKAIELCIPSRYRRGEFAEFSRWVFEQVLWGKTPIPFSSNFARTQFLKIIPIYTNPDRAIAGVSLPFTSF